MAFRLYLSATVVAMALAVPAQARAQEGAAGFVGALGGLTFGTVASAAVAGQGGVRVAPGLFVIGEVGYMRNVLPKEIRDNVDDMAELLSLVYGSPVDIRISAPATYGFGGLRLSPATGRVEPFLEGGVGVGRVSLRLDEAKAGGVDFRDPIAAQIDDEDMNTTKLLLAFGGGVTLRPSSALAVDLGYRYTRIATEDPAINTSMIYGALKFGF